MGTDERATVTSDDAVDGSASRGRAAAAPDAPSEPGDVGERAVALAAELVAIDSVNPGLVPGAAGEAAVVEHLRARLAGAGFETHVITADGHPDRPSLVAVGSSGPSGPTVVLTGHVDTVGVDGMPAALTPAVDGDRMTGRGASDMKAGVAAMVVAAEALAAADTAGRVVLALVADEEDASLGTEAVLRALPGLGIRPDVAVLGEPTWLARTASLRGYALVEVALEGRAAHSSQPELGVNAVAHLGRLLAAVEAHPLPHEGGSLLVTVASGGESPFVLARSARVVVERRTVPGESAADALAEVDAIVAALRADDPSLTATTRLVIAREAWRVDEHGPAATFSDDLAEALADELGDDAPGEPLEAPYWMEAPLWQDAGVPTLVCGPAGGGLHAADEWVDLVQVRAYARALVASVGAWSARHAD